MIRVLDLFSAAAGGWSLGMHRAGFTTMAACEFVEWRRALYSQNNPGVPVYDDVRTLSADRLVRDGHGLPDAIVGSPPCQDISPANTKGKGVEGTRSSLYFDAVRLVGECRPRWFAFENSANLRTRGADAVLAALEALGYACWTFVVRAGDIGANHERPRSWIIGCDLGQIADAGKAEWWSFVDRGSDRDGEARQWSQSPNRYPEHAETCLPDASDASEIGCVTRAGDNQSEHARNNGCLAHNEPAYGERDASDADQAGQADGCMVSSLRQAEVADDGCSPRRGYDGSCDGQMAVRAGDSCDPAKWRAEWSIDELASHLQLDDGLSAWVAGTRVALGTPKGTSAASLIVEAFGDAVVPQIPEAIGLAILRTERALAEVYGRIAA